MELLSRDNLLFYLSCFYNEIKTKISPEYESKFKYFYKSLKERLFYYIVCIGDINTGKSHFINNFFLGDNILPTDINYKKPIIIESSVNESFIKIRKNKKEIKERFSKEKLINYLTENNTDFIKIYYNYKGLNFLNQNFLIIEVPEINEQLLNYEIVYEYLNLCDCILFFFNIKDIWNKKEKYFFQRFIFNKKEHHKVIGILNCEGLKRDECKSITKKIKDSIGIDIKLIPVKFKEKFNFNKVKFSIFDLFSKKDDSTFFDDAVQEFKELIEKAESLVREKIKVRNIDYILQLQNDFKKNKKSFLEKIIPQINNLLIIWIKNIWEVANEIHQESLNNDEDKIRRLILLNSERIENINNDLYDSLKKLLLDTTASFNISFSELVLKENLVPCFKVFISEKIIIDNIPFLISWQNFSENLIYIKIKNNNININLDFLNVKIAESIYNEIIRIFDDKIVATKNINEEYEELLRNIRNYKKIDFELDKKTKIFKLLSIGENDNVEFKAALRYDLEQGKVNEKIEYTVIKTIAGFLNSYGGTLLIGVNDSGEIVGIENDIKTLRKNSLDGFELHLRDKINSNLDPKCIELIKIDFQEINEKYICIIEVTPSIEPVFMKNDFFVRDGNRTLKLTMKEFYEYASKHFIS